MTDLTQPRMRWWGWGEDGHDKAVPPAAEALLREETGMGGDHRPSVVLEDVDLPRPALPPSTRQRLAAMVGEQYVRDDRLARVTHAVGRSYPDLVRIRAGDGSGAPDAVVYPGTPEEVADVLAACAEDGIAVIPFGGGTSVVGGVEALRGDFVASVTVDLARLDRIVATDKTALTATVQAGVTGPELERRLGERGLTFGHYPQSFEFTTVGGWVATRSAGQASTGYGRIDETVLGLRCATPAGEVVLPAMPATAAGPDPRQMFVGSEGALGIITEVTFQVRDRPAAQWFDSFAFESFEAGAAALRRLEQHHCAPDIARLSNGPETAFGMALMGSGTVRGLLGGYLRTRGQSQPCLAVFGFEGTRRSVAARMAKVRALLLGTSGVSLGPPAGSIWARGRFRTPYLRDELLTRGMLVETLETATTWGNVDHLHQTVDGAIRTALAARGTPAYVMCHISHLYPAGCSLYFTFFARQQAGAELEQWWAVKSAASEAITTNGGTITHHHAIGRDHAAWLPRETGSGWIAVLRAAKAQYDPRGIMNPGKLIDAPPPPGSAGIAGSAS